MAHGGGTRAHIDGFLAWWALAGVDMAVDEECVNWLRPAVPPAGARAGAPPHGQAAPAAALPTDLAAFHDHLANASNLPEQRWPGKRVLPQGPGNARLMLVFASPESRDTLISGDAQKLLDRMLGAIGLVAEEAYFASLSLVTPPGGQIDEDALEPLAARMRHHIGLVAPKALLIVGDQTNRALAPTTDGSGGGNLPFVNYSGGIVNAAMIVHPRLLLKQPWAKAGAWNALRQVAGIWKR
ncbi:MAG: uracil-DNA glycosylase family protein [Sphingobium sp.]